MTKTKVIRCPKWLKDEAREFWLSHWQRLVDEGSVDPERDVEGFSLLCNHWRILCQTDCIADPKQGLRYGSLSKLYLAYAKQYGLLPKDRKASGFDKPTNIADVIKDMMKD